MSEIYYVVKLADNEYVESYDLGAREVGVTDNRNHADNFASRIDADYVAEVLGGYIEELTYETEESE